MSEKPISPNEIMSNLDKIIPPVVITAINNLLKKKFRGSKTKIEQNEIISEIISLDNAITRDEIFDNKWLDFEEIYSKNGWDVKYNKINFYDDSPRSYFLFEPKNN